MSHRSTPAFSAGEARPIGPIGAMIDAAKAALELSGDDRDIEIVLGSMGLTVRGRCNTGTSWRHVKHLVCWEPFAQGPGVLTFVVRKIDGELRAIEDEEARRNREEHMRL